MRRKQRENYKAVLLVEAGGGGSKGTDELVDVARLELEDQSKSLAVVALAARPGIDIEKVCPSLRL
jgi:hypothetical protein